jgi:cytochrome c2
MNSQFISRIVSAIILFLSINFNNNTFGQKTSEKESLSHSVSKNKNSKHKPEMSDLKLGKQVFQSCSACHSATEEIVVGPGLKGMEKRRSIEWIVRFVNNPQGMMASGDKYANSLYKKYNKMQMTAYPGIKEKHIKALIAYLDNQ